MRNRNNNTQRGGNNGLMGEEEKRMYACKVWGLETRLGIL